MNYSGLCPRPPKLLHANCGAPLKRALMRFQHGATRPAHAHNLRSLRAALAQGTSRFECSRAVRLRPWLGVEQTVCNASFLLLRHQRRHQRTAGLLV